MFSATATSLWFPVCMPSCPQAVVADACRSRTTHLARHATLKTHLCFSFLSRHTCQDTLLWLPSCGPTVDRRSIVGPGTHEDTETSFWCVRSACVRCGVHRVRRSGRIHRGIVRRVSLTSARGRATSERYIVPEPSVPDCQQQCSSDTSSNLVQSTEGSMTEDSTDLRCVGVTLPAPAVTLTCSTTATRPRQRMWAVVHEFAESAGYERLAKACKVSGGKGICHQDCVPRLFGVPGHLDGCCGACREHCAGCTIEHLGWTATCDRICRPSKRTGWRRRRLTRRCGSLLN